MLYIIHLSCDSCTSQQYLPTDEITLEYLKVGTRIEYLIGQVDAFQPGKDDWKQYVKHCSIITKVMSILSIE